MTMPLTDAVVAVFVQHPWVKELPVDTGGVSANDVADFVQSVVDACDHADIQLKGVRVDPFAAPALSDERFDGAFGNGKPIIVTDPRLVDRVEFVRR